MLLTCVVTCVIASLTARSYWLLTHVVSVPVTEDTSRANSGTNMPVSGDRFASKSVAVSRCRANAGWASANGFRRAERATANFGVKPLLSGSRRPTPIISYL